MADGYTNGRETRKKSSNHRQDVSNSSSSSSRRERPQNLDLMEQDDNRTSGSRRRQRTIGSRNSGGGGVNSGVLVTPVVVGSQLISVGGGEVVRGSDVGDQHGGEPTRSPDGAEDDPETLELARLRCPSECTEIIAERETRRRQRRCADYPGFAFGSSMFSSDSMMKFNIIKNELHNIMNTQLKRVSIIRYKILALQAAASHS